MNSHDFLNHWLGRWEEAGSLGAGRLARLQRQSHGSGGEHLATGDARLA
jgi:hypothetical protein